MAQVWHDRGMPRTRISTTVDDGLLDRARALGVGTNDASLMDAALEALLAQHRAAEVDASYAVYDESPIDQPDDWGDLASFRRAAGSS